MSKAPIRGLVFVLAVVVLLSSGLSDPRPADGHPHIFIDYSIGLLFDPDGTSGIQIAWTFDDIMSSMIAQFDKDRDRSFSAAETATVERRFFQNFKSAGYFLDIQVDGRPIKVEAVKDFRVTADGDRVTYTFVVPLGPHPAEGAAVEVRMGDPTWYVDFSPHRHSPLRAAASPQYKTDCRVEPTVVRCTYRKIR